MPLIGEATAYPGEIAAVGTALMWATSSMAFGVSARITGGFATNHFRVWAAWPVLAVMVWLSCGTLLPAELTGERIWLLLLSGFVGVALGDIGYFHALATIGPRISSVMLASWPIVVVFAGPLGGDPLRLATLPGVLATVVGVAAVLWFARGGSTWNPGLSRRQWWSGIAGGLLASVGQAAGMLLARRAVVPGIGAPEGVDTLAATLVRMTAGLIGIQLFALLQRRALAGRAVFRDRRALSGALLGTCMGPVIGIWLSMLATRDCHDAGVGAALMAIAPLFMLPLAFWFYGSRITAGSLLGTVLTVGGAAWLMMTQAG